LVWVALFSLGVAIAGNPAWAGTTYVDGVSDQTLPVWDGSFPGSHFSGVFRNLWVGAPPSHITVARYAVQWNVMSGGHPAYRASYESWYDDVVSRLRLTPEVALTSYDGVVPNSSGEYQARLEQLLNLKPIRYVEAWNEPNNRPFIPEAAAAHYANSAYSVCQSHGCELIAGDFLDSPNMVGYEQRYKAQLNPTNPPNWGIHPYYAVKAENESTVLDFRSNLPNSGDSIWFTEIGAYNCVHEGSRGERQQAADASWLAKRLMPNIAPAHVFYFEFLYGYGQPPPCTQVYDDTALYVPSGDPYATDVPRAAAAFIYNGKGFPWAYTGRPSSVATLDVTLTGSVYPGGFLDARYHFEYGISAGYGSYSPEGDAGSGLGRAPEASIRLSGLAAGTTYHYRIVAWNSEGANYASDQTFQTRPPPTVATGLVSSALETQASVNAAVNTSELDKPYYFQYGMTEYGAATP
jgi:hypothetical protein